MLIIGKTNLKISLNLFMNLEDLWRPSIRKLSKLEERQRKFSFIANGKVEKLFDKKEYETYMKRIKEVKERKFR